MFHERVGLKPEEVGIDPDVAQDVGPVRQLAEQSVLDRVQVFRVDARFQRRVGQGLASAFALTLQKPAGFGRRILFAVRLRPER